MKFEKLGRITKSLDNKRVPLNSSQREKKSKERLYPYIGANNIMGYIDEYIFDEKILCLAEDGGSWGERETCANIYNEKCWVNNHAHVLVENGKANLEFLRFYLNKTNLNQYITGATRGKLTKSALESILVPLPPLEDQLRIATLLSKAETIIKQRKESVDLLDEYLKSTFLEMFGDPIRNEKNWNKGLVGKYTDCIVPGRDKPKSFSGTTPWFTTSDLIHKGFVVKSKNNLGLSDFEIKEVKAKRIPVGSVIMTCVGDLGVVSINKEVCIVNQQLHAFLCKPQINNVFLMFNLSFMTSYMYKMASTTTVPYMNKTICNSIPVILPDINLQTKFANIVEKTESLRFQYQSSLAELENLYGSLSQMAFKGELYNTNDDVNNDENISLKQIIISKEVQPISLPIENALKLAHTLDKKYSKLNEVSKLSKSFQKQIDIWNKAFEPIRRLPTLPQEIVDFQRKIEMVQSPTMKLFLNEKKKQRRLVWGNISFKQIAELIKEAYNDNYFNNEMLVKYMIDDQVIFPNYYSSEELKKSPKLNESDDYKSFIFTALRDENPFFKLEQFFYDGIDENFLLKLREEDYDSSKSPKDYSGIYFKIIE